ncbi:hypothetical protein BDW68DRAFT_183176 [Aspergillus falconensis]
MPPKTKSTPAKRKPPKRKRTDYDESYAESTSASSDLSMKSPTVVTTGAPTYATTEASTGPTTDAGTAAPPSKDMRTTKVRKPYIQKAQSKKSAKAKARAREKPGKEGGNLLSEDTDWPAMVLQKYPPKKSIATCDRCKLKFTCCDQEPDGCLKCKRKGQTCPTTDTDSRTTWVRGSDVPQHVAAADAQLLTRLKAAVQERDLLRAEVARNPSLQEISQLRLDNKRLRKENKRLERSLAVFIPPGGSNRQAAYAASQLIVAAKPRKPANNDNPKAAGTEPWPSEYGPAPPSEYMGVLDARSPISPSTQTPVSNDNPQPANTKGWLSEYGTLPPGYLGSLDIRGPRTPFTWTPAQPSSSRNAPATNQATPLGNPYTQAPTPLTYEHPEYELMTLPEFARPDTIMYPEVPKDVVSGVPGQTRAREVFPPEWKKYLYREPGEDNESNGDADFDEEMWVQ